MNPVSRITQFVDIDVRQKDHRVMVGTMHCDHGVKSFRS